MTQRLDAARGRDVLARWCHLAEQRLEYLTELFETGRWRRFHSEVAFLENIREAKTAVETWRDLSTREAWPNNNAVDLTWLARPNAKLPRSQPQPERPLRLSSPPLRFSAERAADETPSIAPIDASAFRPDLPALEMALDDASESAPPTIQDRYPLLRNTL
jgi:uncharacterized repeat protein (TIGR03809 family)